MTYDLILADDHPFLLNGVASALKAYPHLNIIGKAENGKALISLVMEKKPDLIVMDLNMPGMDGFQCLKKLKTEFTQVRVLILTNYSQPELIREVQAMNADGFVVKNTAIQEFVEAIDTILAGGTWFKSVPERLNQPADFVLDDFQKKYQLTKREITIIGLICKEMTSKQIADDLFLSELTVNTHRRNIFRKLDLTNVTGLVNFAQKHQLI